MIFVPLQYVNRVKWYPKVLLCEAPKWKVWYIRPKLENSCANFSTSLLALVSVLSKFPLFLANLSITSFKTWHCPFIFIFTETILWITTMEKLHSITSWTLFIFIPSFKVVLWNLFQDMSSSWRWSYSTRTIFILCTRLYTLDCQSIRNDVIIAILVMVGWRICLESFASS